MFVAHFIPKIFTLMYHRKLYSYLPEIATLWAPRYREEIPKFSMSDSLSNRWKSVNEIRLVTFVCTRVQ